MRKACLAWLITTPGWALPPIKTTIGPPSALPPLRAPKAPSARPRASSSPPTSAGALPSARPALAPRALERDTYAPAPGAEVTTENTPDPEAAPKQVYSYWHRVPLENWTAPEKLLRAQYAKIWGFDPKAPIVTVIFKDGTTAADSERTVKMLGVGGLQVMPIAADERTHARAGLIAADYAIVSPGAPEGEQAWRLGKPVIVMGPGAADDPLVRKGAAMSASTAEGTLRRVHDLVSSRQRLLDFKKQQADARRAENALTTAEAQEALAEKIRADLGGAPDFELFLDQGSLERVQDANVLNPWGHIGVRVGQHEYNVGKLEPDHPSQSNMIQKSQSGLNTEIEQRGAFLGSRAVLSVRGLPPGAREALVAKVNEFNRQWRAGELRYQLTEANCVRLTRKLLKAIGFDVPGSWLPGLPETPQALFTAALKSAGADPRLKSSLTLIDQRPANAGRGGRGVVLLDPVTLAKVQHRIERRADAPDSFRYLEGPSPADLGPAAMCRKAMVDLVRLVP